MQGDPPRETVRMDGSSGGTQGAEPTQVIPPPHQGPPQGQPPGYQAYPSYGMPPPPPAKSTPTWLWVLLGAIVFLFLVAPAIAVPVFMSSKSNAEEKSCFANQRTVDSAVMQYSAANDGQYPTGLGDLVPTWIKETPQCQASGATYSWDTGPPPYIKCSKHGRYDD